MIVISLDWRWYLALALAKGVTICTVYVYLAEDGQGSGSHHRRYTRCTVHDMEVLMVKNFALSFSSMHLVRRHKVHTRSSRHTLLDAFPYTYQVRSYYYAVPTS